MPAEELPLISRTIDLEYSSKICRQAYNITNLPDANYWNKLGGFKFSYPRLAQVVGNEDVWRPATPLADEAKPWPESTTSEPFILIEGAGHHWDENGLFPNETTADLPPQPVADAQREEIVFVLEWLKGAKCKFLRGAITRIQKATNGPIAVQTLASLSPFVEAQHVFSHDS